MNSRPCLNRVRNRSMPHSAKVALPTYVTSVRLELLRRRLPPRNLHRLMRGEDATMELKQLQILEAAASAASPSLACFHLAGWPQCRVGHCMSRIDDAAVALAESYRRHDPYDAAGCGRLCARHAAFTVRLDPNGCFCWRDCRALDTAHWVQVDNSTGRPITHAKAISYSRVLDDNLH